MSPPARMSEVKAIPCPFTVLVDSREQKPYAFCDIRAGADRGHAPIDVPTRRIALATGDYAVLGLPRVCIERKSKEDLWSSISQRRANFIHRLARMSAEMDYAAVVVESEWWDVLSNPPGFTHYRAVSLSRTLIAWRQRYPVVDWWFCPSREHAEVLVFRIFERYWLDHKQQAVEPSPRPFDP